MKTIRHISPAVGVSMLMLLLSLTGCDLLLGSDSGSEDTTPDYTMVSTVLGRGYDVFEEYANPEFIKSTILDFDALENAGMIERTSLEQTTYQTVSGTTSSSYQEDMGLTADLEGSYKFFSGSLGSSFTSSTLSNVNNQYATVQVRVRKNMYAVKNRTDPSILKNYLDSDFKERLNDVDYDPDDLFDNYGTHVMVGVITGARYDYNLAATQSSSNTGQSITAYAQANFAYTFGSAAASSSYSYDSATYEAFSSSETSVSAVGGNSAVAAGEDGLNAWIDSINDDTVVFSDYAASDGLVPVWALCDDTIRAASIETAYADWEATKYDQYVQINPIPTTGKLRFTLVNFHNFDVMDGMGGDAEWLYQVKLYSALDGETHKIASLINKENSRTVGQNETHDFGYYTTYYDVPLSDTTNFRLRPLLEEEDGQDLGSNDNEFCDGDGPYIDFTATTTGTITCSTAINSNGTRGWFTTTSGQTSNDSISLNNGESQYFYIVMKEKDSSNDDKCQFKFKVEWDWND